jgi:hypothetical protein
MQPDFVEGTKQRPWRSIIQPSFAHRALTELQRRAKMSKVRDSRRGAAQTEVT